MLPSRLDEQKIREEQALLYKKIPYEIKEADFNEPALRKLEEIIKKAKLFHVAISKAIEQGSINPKAISAMRLANDIFAADTLEKLEQQLRHFDSMERVIESFESDAVENALKAFILAVVGSIAIFAFILLVCTLPVMMLTSHSRHTADFLPFIILLLGSTGVLCGRGTWQNRHSLFSTPNVKQHAGEFKEEVKGSRIILPQLVHSAVNRRVPGWS
jgi:hypothetical protein